MKAKNRRQFIEGLEAKCRNWQWSWCFVNRTKRWVIFGAWRDRETSDGQIILEDDWQIRHGRKSPAYSEALEYIELVKSGYALFTFAMERAPHAHGDDRAPARIKNFEPRLELRKLSRIDGGWLATEDNTSNLPNEITSDESSRFSEGAKQQIMINAYERSAQARAECLAHHGFSCACCGLEMREKYGERARNFIHVHHRIRVSDMGEGYKVDPKCDLVPVCPNCHAVIHLGDPMLTIQELQELMLEAGCRGESP